MKDYSICTENEDGKHGPIELGSDPWEAFKHGCVDVVCSACGESTGVALDLENLEWN